MLKIVSSIGNAAYNTAKKTGLAAGTEQPPYPCAFPLHVINDLNDIEHIEEIANEAFTAAKDLLQSKEHQWSVLDYRDPDAANGGDVVLMTKPHIGPFSFVRATMSFFNCTPERFIEVVHGDDLITRQKFSSDLICFDILSRPTESISLQYYKYWAPLPISPRSLIYLVDQRYIEDEDTWYVFGCSVDFPLLPKENKVIRASALWAWELCSTGCHTFATYTSCMNSNGWVPTFIIGWITSTIGNELVAIRRLIYGQHTELISAAKQFEKYQISEEQLEEEARKEGILIENKNNNSADDNTSVSNNFDDNVLKNNEEDEELPL